MVSGFTSSIRRNQKQWMVVVTILAVFAFLFQDTVMSSGQDSPFGNALMIGALCSAGLAIVGYPRQKTRDFALTGFLVGTLVSYIGFNASGPVPAVRTNVGNFTRADLSELQNRRIKANRFLASVVEKVGNGAQAPNFGDIDDGAIVSYALLHHEANRMGVAVSDDAVNDFLKRTTQDRLGRKEFQEALRKAGTRESEIFDILRDELAVQLVAQLVSAPADAQPAVGFRMAQQTPEQQWQMFRKLHVRQQLTTVALPVTEFVKLISDPSEDELRKFFDAHKNSPGDERGTPGFLEPPRTRLAYLAAADLEAFEKKVPEVTDKEVEDYYLKNKETFRVLDLPEPSGKLPDLNTSPSSASEEAAPADATQVENAPSAAADSPDEKPKEDKAPEKPEAPANPDKPAVNPAKEEEAKKDAAPCGDEPAATKADAKTEPTDKQDGPNDNAIGAAAKTESATPPAPALPADDAPVDAATPNNTGTQPSLPLPPPVARYRELDDDLKDQIREMILRDKAFALMGDAADQAFEFMMELSLKYFGDDPKERGKTAGTFAEQLKQYAEQHGLEYKETKELSRFELATSLDEPIGSATDPTVGGGLNRNSRAVAEEVFEREPSGRGYRLSVYSPRRADTLRGSRYSYWKTLEVPAKVPDLKDAIVRQKVVDAWKFEKARPLAEKRAKELAEMMKKGEADIAAALSGQTINGTSDSTPITIRETPKFTWLRLPQSLPQFGLQRPAPSTIDGIDQPGYEFMKTVFEDLGNGETGVGFNTPRTIFYALRVHNRDAAEAESDGGVALQALQQQFLREQFSGFLPTPYEFLAAEIQQGVDIRWRNSFSKRFAIEFERRPEEAAEDE